MCEEQYSKCRRCKKLIYKGTATALFYRKEKYYIRRHRRSMSTRGRSGWYCDECSELLLKNDPDINASKLG